MNQLESLKSKQLVISNPTLILIGFATAFFPRFFAHFGAPAPINFIHFFVIPFVSLVALFTTRTRDTPQISLAKDLLIGMFVLLGCIMVSAFVNQAGLINALLQFLLFGEAFIFLIALLLMPSDPETLQKLRIWFLGFALSNLGLAIIQSILIPIGIYPRPEGGTLADNIAGVFGGGGGSAANYISCTVSFYAAVYFLIVFKTVPLWIRSLTVLAALYQIQISDSKQVILALAIGGIIVYISNLTRPLRFIGYLVIIILTITTILWAYHNTDWSFFNAYRNWIERDGLYGLDGIATQTKLAAFRIIPTHYTTLLNWLFGLGPGHSVTWLGGWMLDKYWWLLGPFGATIHPASAEVFQVVWDGWVARQSTIFFPLFTWAGLWGDFGFVGLAAYLYLCSIVWRRVCVDKYCQFLMASTFAFGFILTQMEEPGHMLTVAFLLGLRWHEIQLQRSAHHLDADKPEFA